MLRLLPLLFLLFSLSAQAVIQKFGADEHNTVWVNEGDNRFHCSLKQAIPNFGEATFGRVAGDKLQLKFELIHPNQAEREVALLSLPPLWRHDRDGRLLDSIQLNDPTNRVQFKAQQARVALTELEQGLFPTIRYFIDEDDNREVNASISSVKFQPSYQQFLTCLSQLLPYQFDDVKDSRIYFPSGKSELSAINRRRLNEIISYIKADPEVKWAQIRGYTDSRGFRHDNDKLGERRAEAIEGYLESHDIHDVTIEIITRSYGERVPIESNRTPKGRALNRVAMLTLFKQEPAPLEALPEEKIDDIFDTLPGKEPQYKAPLPSAKPAFKSTSEAVTEPIQESVPLSETPLVEPAPEPTPEPPLVKSAPEPEPIPEPTLVESVPEQRLKPSTEPEKPLITPALIEPVIKATTEPVQQVKNRQPTQRKPLFEPITADMVETGK